MVIAVNCRLLQKDRLEGIGWFTYQTLLRITRDHPEHRFIFIFDRPFDPSFIFSENITPVVAGPPTRHPVLWYYWFEWVIPSILRKYRADLFFSPDGFLSLSTKVRSIAVIHDISFAHRPSDLPFFPRTYYNHFFPKFARKAFRVCTVSRHSMNDLAETYKIPRPLLRVVYNGFHEGYRPLGEAEQQEVRDRYSDGKPYFLYVGSLHPRKNLINLLKAYNRFVERTGSDIRMVVAGARMWKSDRTARDLDGLDNGRITFTGRLPQDELCRLTGGALALTFVPWFEGFGIPALESMASGVPVLTSNVTSLPEVCGKAAIYAHPSSVDEISSAMERIAGDPDLRERLIAEGLERSRLFSWDRTARKVWLSIDTAIKSRELYE